PLVALTLRVRATVTATSTEERERIVLSRSVFSQAGNRGGPADACPLSLSRNSVEGPSHSFRSLASAFGSARGISTVIGVTLPSFHAPNENVTLALPVPASSGTRTGPRKPPSQQNLSRGYRLL